MFLSAGVTVYFGLLSVIAFSKAKSNHAYKILGGIGVRTIENPHRDEQKVAAVAS